MSPRLPPVVVWEAHHPGTGRVTEHDFLDQALLWFAGQTVEWLALRWVVPAVALAVLAFVATRKGVRS